MNIFWGLLIALALVSSAYLVMNKDLAVHSIFGYNQKCDANYIRENTFDLTRVLTIEEREDIVNQVLVANNCT